ncbi:MAG: hypothetical protein HY814_10465 [Candidatus Riflebacteria bacterium]|nr:hypothetical protein [Candidatus Riflebacteria bacterium]
MRKRAIKLLALALFVTSVALTSGCFYVEHNHHYDDYDHYGYYGHNHHY